MSATWIIRAASVALVSTMTMSATVGQAQAGVIGASKVCKPFSIPGYGKPRFVRFAAKLSARKAWQVRIANGAHGRAWAKWAIAKDRSFKCAKTGSKWRCRADARPCKN